ncbi:hypothetical protein FUA48_09645 [Flavobacterium alkalisoli]|uniref:Lipoprotein n=1 Tax=Flavobacterium alkalisoli TaxID=2602769 RepID=A0A5B9FVR7_9FLAO|nr:hypothetical protein [Flavobacterium alkalisoli]QEE49838.1 hypothetical protein FUA48_09645 [Flavobacterium alkalisoli]
MNKFKKEQISSFCKMSALLALLMLLSCKDSLLQYPNVKVQAQEKINLSKEQFLSCTDARDTVFKNGDYAKFISIDSDKYGVAIKMGADVDTLNLYMNCQTPNGMIPKFLYRQGCIMLCRGSGFSYRSLIACSMDEDRKIKENNFETERDVSANIDGYVFKDDNNIFFYDIMKDKLLFKKLPEDFSDLMVSKSQLYEDSITVFFREGKEETYQLKQFSQLSYNND